MEAPAQANSKYQEWERAELARIHGQHEAEKDRTAAREHQACVNSRYSAGHDWVKESQERSGIEISRSR